MPSEAKPDPYKNQRTPWRDEEVLRRLYHEKKMTQAEVADELDTSRSTIKNWMSRHGIDPRPEGIRDTPESGHGTLYVNNSGHLVFQIRDMGAKYTIPIHRLVAVAEFGLDAVADSHVHHRNNMKVDNRHGNIEPLTPREHMKRHIEKDPEWGGDSGDPESPWRDASLMREMYQDRDLTMDIMANKMDCSKSTIKKWLDRHGIETADPGGVGKWQ